MKKFFVGLALAAFTATSASAAGNSFQINGQGSLTDGRVFAVNARIDQNGIVSGRATMINTAFSGDSGKGPFRAYVDISCINMDGGEIYLGGLARSNDSNLDGEAVFFAVNDTGSQLSYAYFWDGDPNTTGLPQNCAFNQAGDFPLENVVRGNITVH
jgi:hypothetical protein